MAEKVLNQMKACISPRRKYIVKENTGCLSPEKQGKRLRGFENIEEESIGKGQQEAFHGIPREIRLRYSRFS